MKESLGIFSLNFMSKALIIIIYAHSWDGATQLTRGDPVFGHIEFLYSVSHQVSHKHGVRVGWELTIVIFINEMWDFIGIYQNIFP